MVGSCRTIKENSLEFFWFLFYCEDRIRCGITKLQKARKISVQGRLDGFFKVISTTPNATNKRKNDSKKTKGPAPKKAKAGNFGKRR